MSFKQRIIEVQIRPVVLATKDNVVYGDPINLNNYRTSVDIAFAGGVSQGLMMLNIYNLSRSIMDKFTAIGPINSQNRFHSITVKAGIKDDLNLVYQGQIFEAWSNNSSAPTPVLTIRALSSTAANLVAVKPTQTNGETKLATVLQEIANDVGLEFENINVDKTAQSMYESSDSLAKIRKIADDYRIEFVIESGKLIIFNQLGDRTKKGQEPLVSMETGLINYPVMNSNGLIIESMYNNKLFVGGKLKLQTSIGGVSGIWSIGNVVHNLESFNPDGGAWFTTCLCLPAPGEVYI